MAKHSFVCVAQYTGHHIGEGGKLIVSIDGKHRIEHHFKGYGEAFDCADKVRIHLDCPLRDTAGLAEAILAALVTARAAHLSSFHIPSGEVAPCVGSRA